MNVGDIWNGWTVESILGQGSFGEVYKIVRTNEFGYYFESALKVISIPRTDTELESARNEGMDEESVTSYFKSMVEEVVGEFAIMDRFKGNSNIVSCQDYFYEEKQNGFGWDIYIRMELLTPLLTYTKKNGFSAEDVVNLGIDICKALEICHNHNIIHRDIKPENIFVSGLGEYKLGDFGIARQMENSTSSMSSIGTPPYMAPEVMKNERYNSSVDTYSLGIVLYKFLNNDRLPFYPPYPELINYSDKRMATIKRLSGDPLPMPCNADNSLSEIVLKAASFDPGDRYKSPLDMRRDLEAVKSNRKEKREVYGADEGTELKKDERKEEIIEVQECTVYSTGTEIKSEAEVQTYTEKTLPLIAVQEFDAGKENESIKESRSESETENIALYGKTTDEDSRDERKAELKEGKESGQSIKMHARKKKSNRIIIVFIILIMLIAAVFYITKNQKIIVSGDYVKLEYDGVSALVPKDWEQYYGDDGHGEGKNAGTPDGCNWFSIVCWGEYDSMNDFCDDIRYQSNFSYNYEGEKVNIDGCDSAIMLDDGELSNMRTIAILYKGKGYLLEGGYGNDSMEKTVEIAINSIEVDS